MRKKYLLVLAAGCAIMLAACGASADADAPTAVGTFDESVPRVQPGATLADANRSTAAPEGTQPPSVSSGVTDLDAFVAALKAQGALVFLKDAVEQPFFAVSGQIIEVNGVDVQAYEYANVSDAQAQAEQISPDGSAIGTTMVMWVEAPHYYRSGRLLVLYVGDDAATLSILEAVLGAQFAGR